MPNSGREDPGLDTSYDTSLYVDLQVILVSFWGISWIVMESLPFSEVLGSCGGPDTSVCLKREPPPPVAVVATRCHAWVVVTVRAGTRGAWYRLTGPWDTKQSPPGPGT